MGWDSTHSSCAPDSYPEAITRLRAAYARLMASADRRPTCQTLDERAAVELEWDIAFAEYSAALKLFSQLSWHRGRIVK